MEFLDIIKDIASNIEDKIGDLTESLNKTVKVSIPDIDLPTSIFQQTPIKFFPKIEIAATKGNEEAQNINPLTIKEYKNKYCIESLPKKINLMSDQEKAYLYYFLAHKHRKLREILGAKIEEVELAMNYLDKALSLVPDNADFAYEYFKICEKDDLCFCKDKVIDICETCIRISNNQDTKNEFSNIYSLMGKYYYLEQKQYSKAIDCFKKALEYSENKPKEQQINAYRYLVILYDIVGNFNEALKICDLILSIKPDYFDIPEMRRKIVNKIKAGITVEEVNQKNYDSDMNFYFKNSEGKYPEKYIQEAYDHYLNAQKLVQSRKRAQAIKEYQLIKKMLPEESQQLNDLISMHISIGIAQDEEGMDTNLLFECLFENQKYYSDSGNTKELARIYNELGCAYSKIKDYEEAVEYHKKSLNLREDPYHYYNLAVCYTSMGKYHEAIKIYEKIKEMAPQDQEHLKPDFHIAHLKDIIAGKISPNDKYDNNEKFAEEENKKGDLEFDSHNYEKAITRYNAAFGIKADIKYLFKALLCNNIYISPYYEESEKGFEAVKLSSEKDDFKHLPFICTLYGDAISYEAWGQSKLAKEYYEIAVFLLDMVPSKERFAAPYYKLARLKEKEKKYQDALKLFEQAKEIDDSYFLQDEINRIKRSVQDDGRQNNILFKSHEKLVKQYLNSKSYKKVIEEGKEALRYSLDNVEIYFSISEAAEHTHSVFAMKWAAKEGLRLSLDEYDESNHFYDFIFKLGKCCKYEKKYEQAKYYFNVIIDCDEYGQNPITEKAKSELDFCY